ncbi:hypothetical protein VLK81_06740 [Citroniella saccharovorans]|uniref:Uncharacterized protein n=1 Tax=Citroniella saccharovorans TaxID=2053367 RepID=A0AAW9MZB8_9FIRM|nr:hypothetical protein [Citroniella saccharovorans]MEB3429710.1 hypothetical protein [Citroniella saccharovorans]
MLGLRTQENNEFIKFFELVQAEANKLNKVFFLDFGQCEDVQFNGMEVDSLYGWLIPKEEVETFNKEFINKINLSKWNDYCAWVIPNIINEKLNIVFE